MTPQKGQRSQETSARVVKGGGRWSDQRLKEVVANAVVASKAVYADNDLTCEKFLTENLSDHNLAAVTRSKHGNCHFLIAEEVNASQGGSNR